MRKAIGFLLALLLLCMPVLAADVNPNACEVAYSWSAGSVTSGTGVVCAAALTEKSGGSSVGMLDVRIEYDVAKLRYDGCTGTADGVEVYDRGGGELCLLRTSSSPALAFTGGRIELGGLKFTALAADAGGVKLSLGSGSIVTYAGYENGVSPSMADSVPALTITDSFTLTAVITDGGATVSRTHSADDAAVLVIGAVYYADGRLAESRCERLTAAQLEGGWAFTFNARPEGGTYKFFALDPAGFAPRCAAAVLRL